MAYCLLFTQAYMYIQHEHFFLPHSNGKFAQSCERIKLPDDCTIGFISGEEHISYSVAPVLKSYVTGSFIVVEITFSM